MKSIWCWQCKLEVPMLDEAEFEACFANDETLTDVAEGTTTRPFLAVQRRQALVLERYRQITGFPETNINAFYHHRLSLYGEPCPACGKPFRTPRARYCAECGFRSTRGPTV